MDNLSNLTWVSIAHVTRFVGPALRVLSCKNMVRVTDMALEVVADSCPQLTKLNLMGCNKVTDGSVLALARSCRHLEEVDFTGLSRLTSYSVINLIASCPGITSLVLAGCSLLDNAVLAAAGAQLPGLRKLNIDLCPRMDSAEDLAKVMRRCKSLVALSLQNCRADMPQVVHQLGVVDADPRVAEATLSFIGVKAPGFLKRASPIACTRLSRLSLRGTNLAALTPEDWKVFLSWCGDSLDSLDLASAVLGPVDTFVPPLLEASLRSLRLIDVSNNSSWITIRDRLAPKKGLTVISL